MDIEKELNDVINTLDRLRVKVDFLTFAVQASRSKATGLDKDSSVDTLGLPTRARTACRYYKIKTIGDMTKLTEAQVSHWRGVGTETIRDIKDKLATLGLTFRES